MSNPETIMNEPEGITPSAPALVQVKTADPNSQPLKLHPYKQQRGFFIAAMIVQIGILSTIAIQPAFTIAQGTTVTFTTAPVDPWDMFRGDYVILSYDFSNAVPISKPLAGDTPIYVVLKKSDNGKWMPVRSATEKPTISNGEIVLKGKVGYCSEKTATVHYGIEQVYVSEGAGRRVNSNEPLQVDVAVGTDGSGVVKALRKKDDTIYKFHLI
jgi:uncharacterized membrane-anchored protein